MKHYTLVDTIRFALLVFAGALLSVFGFLALRVNAQEAAEEEIVVSEQLGENREVRRALFDEQKSEREENREDTKAMFVSQNEEREAVRAQTQEDTSDMRLYRADTLREELQIRKVERERKIQEYKAKLSAQKQVRLGQYVQRITVRMNAAIDRLDQIADRVLARLDVQEGKGVDLTDARNELEKAYIAIAHARKFVTLFSEIAIDTISSENPSANIQETREAVQLAKDTIVSIHTTLANTVVLIKATDTEEKTDIEKTVEGEEETASADVVAE